MTDYITTDTELTSAADEIRTKSGTSSSLKSPHIVLDYITTNTELISVADAIRDKTGTSNPLIYPQGFISAIENISGGSSGNLSLARMTLNKPPTNLVLAPCIYNGNSSPMSSGTTQVDIILYQGGAIVQFMSDTVSSKSGNVEDYGEYGDLLVTGDCTVTLA